MPTHNLLLQASQLFAKVYGEEEDVLLLAVSQHYEKKCGPLMSSEDIQSAVLAQTPLKYERSTKKYKHYVIEYAPEGGTAIDTGSNLTHYNLTGPDRNRLCTNITVQAVNLAVHGRSDRSAVIAQYNHTLPGDCSCTCMWCTFNALFLKTHTQLSLNMHLSFYVMIFKMVCVPW